MEEKDIIMEDKELNEQESLKLITQMIQNTRRNLVGIWMPVVEICFYCGGMFVCC